MTGLAGDIAFWLDLPAALRPRREAEHYVVRQIRHAALRHKPTIYWIISKADGRLIQVWR
jgi:hypothetical protein